MKIKKGYNALNGLLEDVVAALNDAEKKYFIEVESFRHYSEIERESPGAPGGRKEHLLAMVVHASKRK